jgi:hypothetical protein
VRHGPAADEETRVVFLELWDTVNTGDADRVGTVGSGSPDRSGTH